MAREILFDLGKMITDRLPYKFGIKRLTETDPEYIILDRACSSDEIAEIMLKMGLRKPKTTAEIAKLTGKSEDRIVELLTDAANHGIVEYNYENPNHEKQWYVQLFVPGIAEMTNMVLWQVEKYPELADSFDKMTFLPLAGKTHLIPPGGDGIGMHVIPVEKAIPAKNESASIEHISHWLEKYDGHFSVGYCSCRNARRLYGQGSGEIQDDCCIGLGDFADYLVETGKGRYITLEGDDLSRFSDDYEELARELAEELRGFIPEGDVLVAGLGNMDITPDAVGPMTVSRVLATRHLQDELDPHEEDFLTSLRKVSTVAPGVLGQTGVETAELLKGICREIEPAAIVAVDALACSDISRLGTTIQISDAGISPGSGVSNARKELSSALYGIPVIAVGVPTVVDMHTIVRSSTGEEPSPDLPNMLVTPRDIDRLTERASQLLAFGIDLALHPALTFDDVRGLF